METSTDNETFKSALTRLLEESEDYLSQHKCGCQHPACRRCKDDQSFTKTIEQTNALLQKK